MISRYIVALMIAACIASTTHAAEEKVSGAEHPHDVPLASTTNVAEEKTPDWNATTLTGDWGGTRTSLYNKGINWAFTHKSDFLANTSGGLKRGANWMGYTEAGVKMDLEKLWGWDSTTAYVHYHSELGTQFNQKYVGSFVGVDNIETAANTAQFNSIWIQKSMFGDNLSVLAGLYAIDSEFYVTDTTGLFIQPPYGMSNDVAQTINNSSNAPAIYPVGALAVRVKYTSPSKSFYAQYALADGVPGDPNNPRGTHVQLNKGDGTLSIVELGYTPQEGSEPPFPTEHPGDPVPPETKIHEESETFNKTAIGFWNYTARFDDLIDVNALGIRPSYGAYFLAERTLFVEKDHPSQGLSGFVRFGTASKDVHQADWTGSLGLRYHGLCDGRDDDIAGIAVTYNHASDKFRQLVAGTASNQTQVEATYRAQIKPWFALQPTLQFISNPNMKIDANGNPTLQNVWIIGTRAEIAF